MSAPDVVDEVVLKAREKVAAGLFEEAHILYSEFLERSPGDHDVLVEKGLLYLSSKEYETAMTYLDTARLIKDTEKLQLAVSECLLRLGLVSEAVALLKPLEADQPMLLSCRLLLALASCASEASGDALFHCEVVLRLEPSNPFAQRLKALAMCQLGLHTDSLALFDSAQTPTPNSDTLLAYLFAQALYKYDQLEECIQQLNTLLEVEKQHVDALMLKANALEDLGRLEEADSVMEQLSLLTGHTLEP